MVYFMLKSLTLTSILLWVFQENEAAATLKNVGPKGSARQSSTSYGRIASRGIDGSPVRELSSCTHTDVDNTLNPWWEVDLGDYYLVEEIELYNRMDCCGGRLYNVHVSVSNDSSEYSSFGYHAGIIGEKWKIITKAPLSVRWVKVYLSGNRILTLCEVKIMSRYTLKKIYFNEERQGEETMLCVKGGAQVPLRAVKQCIQSCGGIEKSFFTRFMVETPSSLYLECYCPV